MAVVEGRLQIRDWKDKDGNNRRSAEVVADNVFRRQQARRSLRRRLCAPGLRLSRFHLLRPAAASPRSKRTGSSRSDKIYKGGYFHGYGTRKQRPLAPVLLRTASAARSASSALTSANISTTRMPPSCAASFPSAPRSCPQDHRHLCHASASADRGDQARPSDRSAALRHRITANEKETRGACLFFPEQALHGERSALAAAERTAQLRRASVLRSKILAEGRFICPGRF